MSFIIIRQNDESKNEYFSLTENSEKFSKDVITQMIFDDFVCNPFFILYMTQGYAGVKLGLNFFVQVYEIVQTAQKGIDIGFCAWYNHIRQERTALTAL